MVVSKDNRLNIKLIDKAIKICENEEYMRKIVSKNKPQKQAEKIGEMRFVISVLNKMKDEIILNLFK